MPICPYCQLLNPQHHNFCQGCGKSLKHYVCRSCGHDVEFDAESCPQCQASSGTYWWAIIEPTAVETTATAMGVESAIDRELADPAAVPAPIPTEFNKSAELELEISGNPWDVPVAVLEPVDRQPAKLWLAPTDDDDLEISPWDRSADIAANSNGSLSSTPPDATATFEAAIHSQPAIVTTYLDPQCNYRLLDPVALQLLKLGDSSQVRVIDRQPFCNTPLEILMEQEPVTLASTVESMKPHSEVDTAEPPATPPIAAYRQWQFWNKHGIPKVAQAYIALQVSLPGTVPPIRDSWNKDGKTVTIVEDRSHWEQLAASWNDPQIPPSQTIYWLDYTLKLWVALEPWQMRQSLLETANLLLDEDGRICLQRLYPEPADRQLQLADLAVVWKKLCDEPVERLRQRFPERDIESPHPASIAIANLLQSIHSGEVERVEEVRSRLQQIAYELEPKQLSAPLQSMASADLSSPQDAPTIVLAQKLLGLEDAASTHTGKKRDHNEDCFGIVSRVERYNSPKDNSISARGLYILCDGMGGHDGGEIASAMTVDILRDYFATRWNEGSLPEEQTIREGIVAANEAVFEINQKKAAHGSGRMGTTLVLVLVQDRNIAVAHVGDSRCYGITPSQGLIQLTLDHEVGQQQILRGVDPEIAYGRPDSYQLTQAIGPRDRNYIAPDIRFFELQEDTLIVLASDGLTDNQLLESYWLTNVAPLLSSNTNLQDGVDRLIDFANEYNGHDNITALVVRAKLG